MKLLTFIVPMYNMERYIKRCIDSFIPLYDLQNIEVLIIDDGSTDRSYSVAADAIAGYERLFRLLKKENGGYGSVINFGIENSCSRYIRLIDSDDYIDADAARQLISSISNIECDVICTPYIIHNMNQKIKQCIQTPESIKRNHQYQFDSISEQIFIAMHSMTIKRSIFTKNNIKIDENMYYTDLEFVLFPIEYTKTVIFYDYPVYQYIIGREGQSVSHSGLYKHRFDHELVIFALVELLGKMRNCNAKYKYIERKTYETITVHYRYYSQFDPAINNDLRMELLNFTEGIDTVFDEWKVFCKDFWVNLLIRTNFHLLKCIQYLYKIKHTRI